jgi:catechol 2,3-dioxygenase-like lactoylglutathione lyase family enzyme
MLRKVPYVALLVSDQDKALDFYTNVIVSRGGSTLQRRTDRGS